jgi:hypothetical protein
VLQIKAGLEGQEKRRADYKKTLPAKIPATQSMSFE